jgi:NAD(P)-dependent dehydrogenase (short-subunit alcohol dehydrogenase family)
MSKVIVITGAGDGLGRALARRFAKDGARVVLLGRTLNKLEDLALEIGNMAVALACDVSDPEAVRHTFVEVERRYGTVDVLINNAAFYDVFALQDARDDQIASTIETNLMGPMYCARSAIPLMQSGAHIINVSSDGVELPFPLMSVYQASKAGLERFTTALHRELESVGIRVSFFRAAAMAGGGKGWDLPPDVRTRFVTEAGAVGLDLRTRPVSSYESAALVFRTLIDLPADVHALSIGLVPRKA